MQICAGDQAAGELKVQGESRSQGCSQFQGKEGSGAHQDGSPGLRAVASFRGRKEVAHTKTEVQVSGL